MTSPHGMKRPVLAAWTIRITCTTNNSAANGIDLLQLFCGAEALGASARHPVWRARSTIRRHCGGVLLASLPDSAAAPAVGAVFDAGGGASRISIASANSSK